MKLSRLLVTSIVVSPLAAAQSADLLVHFPLDDTGPNAANVGQINVTGQYFGGTQGQPGAAPGTRTSVEFGPGAYVEIPGSPPLDQLTNDLSACAWFYLNSTPTGVARIFGNQGPSGSWSFGVLGGVGLRFTTHFVLDYDLAAPVQVGQWHHVAVTMDTNNDVTFYLDGAAVGTLTGASPANAPNPAYLIGAFNPGGAIPEHFNGRLDDVQVYDGVLTPGEVQQLFTNPATNLGSNNPVCCGFCVFTNNSTGMPAVISADGTNTLAENDLQLTIRNLPQNSFGFFLASLDMGLVPNAGGSQGTLCLGGSIGRYVGPGQIRNSGSTGEFAIRLDLTQVPQPTGFVSAMPGETWHWQAWYRDTVGGMPTSNFSNGRVVNFL